MPKFLSTDRNSKFYSMHITGRQLHIDLHPNKSSGGFFRVQSVQEGEALIERLRGGLEALAAEAGESSNANVHLPSDPEGEV